MSRKYYVVAHQSKHYSGPMPQPSDLQKYEDIKVGFSERILAMAERESTHRQNLDNRIITSERAFNILGQMTALSIGVLVIALMGYAISQGFAEQVQWIGVLVLLLLLVYL